jgi:hypothetical protein
MNTENIKKLSETILQIDNTLERLGYEIIHFDCIGEIVKLTLAPVPHNREG